MRGRFSADIRRFGTALKVIKMFEPIFAMIPVSAMLKIFRFSKVGTFWTVLTCQGMTVMLGIWGHYCVPTRGAILWDWKSDSLHLFRHLGTSFHGPQYALGV